MMAAEIFIVLIPCCRPTGPMGKRQRLMAMALYHLYHLNWPERGDILYALAKVRRLEPEESDPNSK